MDFDTEMAEFFEAGDKGHIACDDPGESLAVVDARHARKMTAAARARRAHLSRYVKWVVSGAAALALSGIAADRLRHSGELTSSARTVSQETPREPVTETRVLVSIPSEVEQEPVAEATDVASQAHEAKPEPQSEPLRGVGSQASLMSEPLRGVGSQASLMSEPLRGVGSQASLMPIVLSASQAKQAARDALERGANAAAIAAGERAVVLDGSDAEAWLVLGAAYQATGKVGHAKGCYTSCVSQGKQGPIDECRDMLSVL